MSSERKIELCLQLSDIGEIDKKSLFERVHKMYGLTNPSAELWFYGDLNILINAELVKEIETEPHPFNKVKRVKASEDFRRVFDGLTRLIERT